MESTDLFMTDDAVPNGSSEEGFKTPLEASVAAIVSGANATFLPNPETTVEDILDGLVAPSDGMPSSFSGDSNDTSSTTLFPPFLSGFPGLTAGAIDNLFLQRKECGHYAQMDDDRLHPSMDAAAECVFWTQGVCSLAAAAFGLLGNAVSIWILSVPEMRCTAFNRLLLALAIVDCLFIAPGVVVYTAKAFHWWQSDAYNYAFPVFLYPFTEIALCSSIFMTVAIAVERYIGLCRPLQRLSGHGPYSAKCYIFPVLILSIVLNVPKFLESETVTTNNSLYSSNPSSMTTKVAITELRMNPHYITYYTMWFRLLTTGLIPLLVLAVLNTKIYLSIRHSKQQLRILAIRSALPMAILGQSAPPPLSDLIGSSNATTSSTRIQNTSSDNANGDDVGSSSPLLRSKEANGSPRNGYSNNNHQAAAVAADNNNSPAPRRHIVNGQLRQIQRSVSAIEPAIKRTLRLKDPHILRSNSTTVAGVVAKMNPSNSNSAANVIALASQWQQGASGSAASADIKLAPILFGVVIVFVFCNSLRVLLNIYDFSVLDDIIDCHKKGLGRYPPTWVMCSISVSHLLLMINSSVNFLVYCLAGTRFRRILFRKLRIMTKSIVDTLGCCKAKSANVTSSILPPNLAKPGSGNNRNGTPALATKFQSQRNLVEDVLEEEDEEEEEDDVEQGVVRHLQDCDARGEEEVTKTVLRDEDTKTIVRDEVSCKSDNTDSWDKRRERWRKHQKQKQGGSLQLQ